MKNTIFTHSLPRIHWFFLLTVLALTVSCGELAEPVASADSAINTVDDPINKQGDDKTTDTKINEVANFTSSVPEGGQSVLLTWQVVPRYDYSIVRASNPDCDPKNLAICIDDVTYTSVTSPYEDTDIQSGKTYYYWALAQLQQGINQQAIGVQTSSQQEIVVSKPVNVTLDLDKTKSGITLRETIDIEYLEEVSLVQTSNNTASITWKSNPEVVVTIFSSKNPDCDVLDTKDICAQKHTVEQPGSSSEFSMASDSTFKDYYFWVHAARNIPLLAGENSVQSRLYGPIKTYNYDGNHQSVKISEIADFHQHGMNIVFPSPRDVVYQVANYNIYTISGNHPLDQEIVAQFSDRQTSFEALKLAVAADNLQLNLHTVSYQALRQLSTGELFLELSDIQSDTWYTVVLQAQEGIQTTIYQPYAFKSLQHMQVNVRGDNGLWQIRNKQTRNVYIAKKSSGIFYPSTLDWRHLIIDAKLSYPESLAYYFTGCAYYVDNPELGATSKLYNNECHFSTTDADSGITQTILSQPLPVNIIFERKAQALACNSYVQLPSYGYKRSREHQLEAYGQAICDHRISATDTNGNPNYFAMVYPHGEPTELAHSKVKQWYAGTQVPMYMNNTVPLPVVPDGIVKTSVCLEMGEEGKGCTFNTEITVVRCNGYYTYQLVQPSGCSVGYAWEETPISALHRKEEEATAQ